MRCMAISYVDRRNGAASVTFSAPIWFFRRTERLDIFHWIA